MAESTRNIGIIAHIDAGKTTTTERILYYTGKTHRIGEVDSGSATMDWMEQEQDRGITIVAAATTCHWRVKETGHTAEVQINLIDTPGHVDFTAEVERSLRVLDGAVAVLCAVKGIEPQTETVWRQAEHYHVPRLVYINKIDRAGANFAAAVQQLRDKFAVRPLVLYLPIGAESNYSGNIDVLRQEELYFEGEHGEQIQRKAVSEANSARAKAAYDELIDLLSENEDRIAELYLEGQEIPLELCQEVIRRLCLNKEIVPVYAGSSLKNKGVQQLLDGIALYLPSPADVPPLRAPRVGDKKSKNKLLESSGLIELHAKPDEELAALVFKVQYHKEMGMLCYLRVYSGILKANKNIFNVRKNKRERINRLIQMHANSHNPVAELQAGEIGVVVGFKFAQTGDTICDEKSQVLLESMDFPEPVISLAIELQSGSDGEKLELALEHMQREDPTFHVQESSDTGQVLLSGMGELHLEVLCTRLREEHKLEFRTGKPRVTHREALQAACKGRARFEHEIAGVQHEISVELELKPIQNSEGTAINSSNNHFKNLCDDLPQEHVQLIEDAAMRHLETGFRLGYPATNVEILLHSCTYNTEEPYTPGIESATAYAIDYAVQQQETLLLEPIMKISVMTPAEYVGDVISQLTQSHGQVHSMDSQQGYDVINATAPLSQLFGYSTRLRSQTQGRGSFSFEFDHFAPCI